MSGREGRGRRGPVFDLSALNALLLLSLSRPCLTKKRRLSCLLRAQASRGSPLGRLGPWAVLGPSLPCPAPPRRSGPCAGSRSRLMMSSESESGRVGRDGAATRRTRRKRRMSSVIDRCQKQTPNRNYGCPESVPAARSSAPSRPRPPPAPTPGGSLAERPLFLSRVLFLCVGGARGSVRRGSQPAPPHREKA